MKIKECNLTFGIIFCVISLVIVAVSFATDQWINCHVQDGFAASYLNNSLYTCKYCPELFYTRNRGLFRTCYPNSGTQWINVYPYLKNSLVDNACLAEIGYDVSPGDPSPSDYGQWNDYYQMRMDMMRAHWALFVVAIALLLICSILGTAGCWKLNGKHISATAALLLIAALTIVVGMGVFHGYYALEKQITQAPLIGLVLYNSSYADLKKATYCGFGYSYGLGWAGLGTTLIAFILFLETAVEHWINSQPLTEQKPKVQAMIQPSVPIYHPQSLATEPNSAYFFFDQVAHHPKEPTAYPIPFDPYDLHLPTGVSSDALRLPRIEHPHGKLEVPMLHSKLPVNY